MPDYISGDPATVENNLPSAKNISSSTNATPIVITTSAAHDLSPGEVVEISGAADPNANGIRMVGLTPSSTTFQVLTYPGGANVAGSLVGGAAGTVQSLGFGVAIQIPTDDDDDMDAVTVNVPFQAFADRTAWLMYKVFLTTRSISVTRAMDTDLVNESTGAVYSAGGAGAPLGVGENIAQTIRVPNGATITAVTVYIDPPNDGTMPGNRPTVTFRKVNIVTGVAAGIAGPTTDPNSTLAPYEAVHGFGFTGLSEVVNRETTVYLIRVSGEAGANATAINVLGTVVTYTTSGVDRSGN